jgi:hypothetical protein
MIVIYDRNVLIVQATGEQMKLNDQSQKVADFKGFLPLNFQCVFAKTVLRQLVENL